MARTSGNFRLAAVILAIAAFGAGLPVLADANSGKVTVQWFGQSAFRITSAAGKVILIDPWLTGNPKTPERYKDLKALGLLPAELSPRFNKGGVITPLGPGIRITMTRAEHSSEFRWQNPETRKTEVHVGGEPAGFIIEFENGFRLYHMGDTGLFGDLDFIGRYYRPDLVLMPIGGHFVLSPADAAYATRQYLKPRYVIPMHYGTNPNLRGTPGEYLRALGHSKTEVKVLQPGEEIRF